MCVVVQITTSDRQDERQMTNYYLPGQLEVVQPDVNLIPCSGLHANVHIRIIPVPHLQGEGVIGGEHSTIPRNG